MADKEQGINSNSQGISGGFVERTLFSDASTQLAHIWAIPSIREIPSTESLQIPNEVYQYTQQQYGKSDKDGKERSASIGWNNGVVVGNEQVGKKTLHELVDKRFFSSISLSVDTTLEFAVKRLFSKSRPIDFHLHPDFTDEFVRKIKPQRANTMAGKTFAIPTSSYISYIRFRLSTYSSSDLGMLLDSNRYTNSLLLMTPQRYLYVTPSELRLKFGMKGYNETKKYDKEMDIALAAGSMFYYNLKTDDIIPVNPAGRKNKLYRAIHLSAEEKLKHIKTEDDLFALRDKALINFCDENNLTAFATKSRFSRELKKLN